MATFTRCSYKFNINNTDYIDALVTYAGNLEIEELTPASGISLKNIKIKDLPQFIAQIKAQQHSPEDIEITLKTKLFAITQSLKNVFPKYKPLVGIQDDPRYQDSVKVVSDFIKRYTLTTGLEDLYAWIFPDFSPLTRNEAWKVLHLACKQTPVLSAIELPSQHCIIGLTTCGSTIFRLSYGPESSSIGVVEAFGFDIDDGFFTHGVSPDDPHNNPIPGDLVRAARLWIENDRKGPVLSSRILASLTRPPQTPSASRHRHLHQRIFRIDNLLIAPILVGFLYLLSFSAPVILACTVLGLMGFSALRHYTDSIGCKKAVELTLKDHKMTPDKQRSFLGGIEAGKTYLGCFNAWKIKEAYYPHYDTYLAGKHLAEHNAEQDIVQNVARLSLPTSKA